jgi:hypothetical protein
LKERPSSSLLEEIPVSIGMSEEREEEGDEGAPLEEQSFALGSLK